MSERILCVSPHPDDEAIGCGGTLRLHADRGDAVRVVFLTSGEKGVRGRSEEEARAIREAEAARAAIVLGIAGTEFWRCPDGALRATAALAGRLAASVRERGERIVYAPHPADGHPDHRAAARLVRRALRNADVEVRFYEVWTPLARLDEVVDVSTVMAAKRAAVACHASQCAVLRFDEACEGFARWRGAMFCWPKPAPDTGRFAEVFARMHR